MPPPPLVGIGLKSLLLIQNDEFTHETTFQHGSTNNGTTRVC